MENWYNAKISKPSFKGRYLCILVNFADKPIIEICTFKDSGVDWFHEGFGNVGENVAYWMVLPEMPASLIK